MINISKEEYKFSTNLDLRNFRLLSEYEKENDSNIVKSEQEMLNHEDNSEKVLCRNIKGKKLTNIQSRRRLFYDEFHKQYKVQKKLIYGRKKLSRFERKFFKQLDYIDFIKKNPSISNKTYQTLVCKKFGHKIFLPALVLSWVLLGSLGTTIYGTFQKITKDGEQTYDFTLFLVLYGILVLILIICLAFIYIKFRKRKRIIGRKC
ncbi:Plasmodium exported protein (Pm-fam-a like), unknown function [Plasmodium malariae]|uniref:Uncharacterized protein n=1 Tax=Plasmodium malariae TaxID=5858 RepID=A0A1A8X1B9_PLAMA|nr:Plasmodium exported protein (Pm-fam-a like), unknown function [Plasmodium malariae]